MRVRKEGGDPSECRRAGEVGEREWSGNGLGAVWVERREAGRGEANCDGVAEPKRMALRRRNVDRAAWALLSLQEWPPQPSTPFDSREPLGFISPPRRGSQAKGTRPGPEALLSSKGQQTRVRGSEALGQSSQELGERKGEGYFGKFPSCSRECSSVCFGFCISDAPPEPSEILPGSEGRRCRSASARDRGKGGLACMLVADPLSLSLFPLFSLGSVTIRRAARQCRRDAKALWLEQVSKRLHPTSPACTEIRFRCSRLQLLLSRPLQTILSSPA